MYSGRSQIYTCLSVCAMSNISHHVPRLPFSKETIIGEAATKEASEWNVGRGEKRWAAKDFSATWA